MEQRELKFRSAHYKHDGTFSGFTYWGMIDLMGSHSEDSFAGPTSRNGTVRKFEEQYTGKKDCKGTEIYDGDIIEFDVREWGDDKSNIHVVSWDDEDGRWSWGGGLTSDMEYRTVIGNIHENPELIK